ncbi:MAG: hypothetical protein JWQ63_3129 [Mucilaginibacter sp.]|nr:hypothetical protein [Mucilaginibacter sp.]
MLPLLILSTLYIITDPFQNILPRDEYAFDYMMLSRGNVSTKVYLKNKDKYIYDSFIFGSSRSCSHTSKEWAKYLSKDNVPFSFGAWNESIEGIYRRIKLIDSLKGPLKNAFIIIDVDRTFAKSDTDKVSDFSSDHYLISGISKYDYYMNDYFSYLKNPLLILTSIDYKLFHRRRWYMESFVHMDKGDLDPVNNDWDLNSEKTILTDSISYYKGSADKFYKRSPVQKIAKVQISKKKEQYLLKIFAVFKRHHTNYKIVIAPLYDQIKLNPQDILVFDNIFGKSNVYDYSGINEITDNLFNYGKDVVHYRKKVGNLIYEEIYH